MKIAIVTYSLKVGGVESVIFNLANSFKDRGHFVKVFETEGKGEWCDYFRRENIPVKTFSFNLFTIPLFHVRKIARHLKSFDCILINDAPYAQAGVGLMNSTTKVFPILHLNLDSMIKNATSSYNQLNGIICVSPLLRVIVLKKVPTSDVEYIPNGVSLPEFKERAWEEPFRFLFVGRLDDKQKGVLLIPRIFKIIKNKGLKIKVDIIGDGPSLKELRQLVDEYSLQSCVTIHGALPNAEVRGFMIKSHFLIMPSYFEGLPVALLEAMSYGLIPIVSYLKGHTDFIIKEGQNGFFATPGYKESFVNAIIKALSKPQNLSIISQIAFHTVEGSYNINGMANSYLDLFGQSRRKIIRNNKVDYSVIPYLPALPIIISKILRRIKSYRKLIGK